MAAKGISLSRAADELESSLGDLAVRFRAMAKGEDLTPNELAVLTKVGPEILERILNLIERRGETDHGDPAAHARSIRRTIVRALKIGKGELFAFLKFTERDRIPPTSFVDTMAAGAIPLTRQNALSETPDDGSVIVDAEVVEPATKPSEAARPSSMRKGLMS
jgi:hypothetical protein